MTEKLKQLMHAQADSVDFATPDLSVVMRTGDRRRRARRLTVIAGVAAVVLGVAVLVPSLDGQGGHTTAGSADGSSVAAFRNLAEYVATATFVIEGQVVAVERGDPVIPNDGSGREITPRLLVVEVADVVHDRAPRTDAPATLRVTDGYWEDGVGHASGDAEWVQPGQSGYFFVSHDRAPDGSLLSTYSPLAGQGIVLVDESSVTYPHGGVWRSLGDSATLTDFREVLDRSLAAVRSGAAKPVLVTVCRPSVPGDEDSEPVCVKE